MAGPDKEWCETQTAVLCPGPTGGKHARSCSLTPPPRQCRPLVASPSLDLRPCVRDARLRHRTRLSATVCTLVNRARARVDRLLPPPYPLPSRPPFSRARGRPPCVRPAALPVLLGLRTQSASSAPPGETAAARLAATCASLVAWLAGARPRRTRACTAAARAAPRGRRRGSAGLALTPPLALALALALVTAAARTRRARGCAPRCFCRHRSHGAVLQTSGLGPQASARAGAH